MLSAIPGPVRISNGQVLKHVSKGLNFSRREYQSPYRLFTPDLIAALSVETGVLSNVSLSRVITKHVLIGCASSVLGI